MKEYSLNVLQKGQANKIRRTLSVVLYLSIVSSTSLSAQNQPVPEDVQYKKRPTDAIAAIAMGKADEAIADLKDYLGKYPNDAESHYALGVAYASIDDIETAMIHLRRAHEVGLPLERFIAGPRELLKNLIESKEFASFSAGKFSALLHGPLLGDVTATSAKVWIRTDRARKVILVLEDARGNRVAAAERETSEEDDFTTIINLVNLRPSSKYSYSLSVDGEEEFAGGTFHTRVTKGDQTVFKIGFGGGAGYTPWFERMWDTLSQQEYDAFLLLGDNVYIDYPEVPMAQEYCYYRRQSRPEFRRFTPHVPIYAIWDDHDFTINDGEGGPDIETPAWKRPVWDLYKRQWANPYYAGDEEHPGCWFDFSIGDVDFIMLDCRYYRENPAITTDPSMLGEYQKSWLKEKLLNSKATFKIIASSVPWAKDVKPGSDDTWDGFPKEREEIFSFIQEHNIDGVLLLAADRHRSDAWRIDRPRAYPLYEFMSSRLTNVHTHDLMPHSLFGYNKKCSFGTLEFDTTLDDPKVTYVIKNIDNQEIHKITVYKSQLDFEKDKVINKREPKKK
jgi:alkaline phosphatase D